ncbi:MAG: DUF4492 domain-containing protein [Wolinella sp.]
MYRDGFRNLKVGQTLWKLIFIKLFVMFVVLRGFVFDTTLGSMFESAEEKSEFVLKNLTKGR